MVVFGLLQWIYLISRRAFAGAPAAVIVDETGVAGCLEAMCEGWDVVLFQERQLMKVSNIGLSGTTGCSYSLCHHDDWSAVILNTIKVATKYGSIDSLEFDSLHLLFRCHPQIAHLWLIENWS